MVFYKIQLLMIIIDIKNKYKKYLFNIFYVKKNIYKINYFFLSLYIYIYKINYFSIIYIYMSLKQSYYKKYLKYKAKYVALQKQMGGVVVILPWKPLYPDHIMGSLIPKKPLSTEIQFLAKTNHVITFPSYIQFFVYKKDDATLNLWFDAKDPVYYLLFTTSVPGITPITVESDRLKDLVTAKIIEIINDKMFMVSTQRTEIVQIASFTESTFMKLLKSIELLESSIQSTPKPNPNSNPLSTNPNSRRGKKFVNASNV